MIKRPEIKIGTWKNKYAETDGENIFLGKWTEDFNIELVLEHEILHIVLESLGIPIEKEDIHHNIIRKIIRLELEP